MLLKPRGPVTYKCGGSHEAIGSYSSAGKLEVGLKSSTQEIVLEAFLISQSVLWALGSQSMLGSSVEDTYSSEL